MMGRVTLNPAKHIDPFGTIILPLIMLAGSAAAGGVGFIFGWAKPVPVNFGALRNPKRDMIWVALAGPGCNLLQAVIWGIILKLLVIAGVQEQFFLQMAVYGISINIFLMAFNLIPIPPLDGGRVAVGILPWSVGKYLDRIEPMECGLSSRSALWAARDSSRGRLWRSARGREFLHRSLMTRFGKEHFAA